MYVPFFLKNPFSVRLPKAFGPSCEPRVPVACASGPCCAAESTTPRWAKATRRPGAMHESKAVCLRPCVSFCVCHYVHRLVSICICVCVFAHVFFSSCLSVCVWPRVCLSGYLRVWARALVVRASGRAPGRARWQCKS